MEARKSAGQHPEPDPKIPEPVVGFVVAIGEGDRNWQRREICPKEKEIILTARRDVGRYPISS